MSDRPKPNQALDPTGQQSALNPTSGAVKFQSSAIGVTTAKRQDPFAEQNKQVAKKLRENKKKRKIVIIVLSSVGGAVAIGLVAWLIIWLVTSITAANDMSLGGDAATVVQDEAQGVLSDTGNIDDVTTYFDNQINGAEDDSEKADLMIIEMSVYADNAAPQKVVDASERVNSDNLSSEQRSRYYGMLVNAYMNLGDEESAYYYIDLMEQEGLLEAEGVEG